MSSPRDVTAVQKQIWNGSIPLQITLASTDCRTFDESDPYLIQVPRLSYIPFLLGRLHAFFAPSLINPDVQPSQGWLSFEDVPLKWHHPIGLLYDLYSGAEPFNAHASSDDPLTTRTSPTSPTSSSSSGTEAGALPWRLTLHYAAHPPTLLPLDPALKSQHDAFINAVKEADFLRNGSAKAVMSLSKDSSDALWRAVQTHDLPLYNSVHARLVTPPAGGRLRHVPLKLYLPSTSGGAGGSGASSPPRTQQHQQSQRAPASKKDDDEAAKLPPGALRTIQAPIQPNQTLGTALNTALPSLFPSRRSPLLAQPVLHGAVVPLAAPVDELGRAASYADGFLHLVVWMMG
ncbi:autophagy protein 5 [Phyllosticta citribraziliensis]|uniref:Autophagy protein 5 n=1 Tax=Phyllosticta citribraziliensis TaxID=989973 RepID=A0ABR1M3V6_9PEZI